MNVFDCDLQIIDNLDHQLWEIALLALFTFFSFFDEISQNLLTVAFYLLLAGLYDFGVLAVPLRGMHLSYDKLKAL